MSRAKSPRTAASLPQWAAALGQRLREARAERRMSLSAVSEATGVSTSFLSLLEQGGTDVSLGRLLPILDYYGLEISEVVADRSGPADHIVRHDQRPMAFSPAQGIEVFLASRDQRRAFVPLVVEIQAGSSTENWSRHATEEFLMVLSGRLRLELADDAPVTLGGGDSLFITGERGHRLAALDTKPARALIVTAPTNRP